MARPQRPSIEAHHAEWLSLVETSGPFLTVPALKRALPDGLDEPLAPFHGGLRRARSAGRIVTGRRTPREVTGDATLTSSVPREERPRAARRGSLKR